jgi:hypothetical protein
LERELISVQSNGKVNGYTTPGGDMNSVDIDHDRSRESLEHEIKKLREENQKLNAENSFLRPQAVTKKSEFP